MSDHKQEPEADIMAEIGEKSEWCHNNILGKTWEDWERMHEWLLDIRRRFESAVLRKAIEYSKKMVPGNAAAMREALVYFVHDFASFRLDVEHGILHMMQCMDFVKQYIPLMESALAAPERNCDLKECSTIDGMISAHERFCKSWHDAGNYCSECPYNSKSQQMITCREMWLLAQAKKGGAE